jgi:hypothetical protein
MMISTPYLPTIESIQLDAILADAMVLNWNDVMPESTAGLIHVEYRTEPLGSVEFVKVWASTIWGYWNLICEHWMRWEGSRPNGVHFSNGYRSDKLEKALDSIMQHQEIFLIHTSAMRDHMIQVSPPNESDRTSANKTMELFRGRLAS